MSRHPSPSENTAMENFSLETEAPQSAKGLGLPTPACSLPLVVAYGGGLNSTAMLCGFRESGIVPALILFADTDGEMPETYAHTLKMKVVASGWWPETPFEVVKKLHDGEFEGLEKECIRGKKLPALAYGSKACSMKYKIQPQTKRLKEWMDKNGIKSVQRAIGYDAKESHRATHIEYEDLKKGRSATNWFPLIEWQWRREECAEAIKRHNLPIPGKSACFFCPAMKRGEIIRLKSKHPHLFDRAVAMEKAANGEDGSNKQVRGLTGRSFMWSDIVADDEAQAKLWEYLDENDESPTPCGCYDG
jgi:3'-phosphoadenosine 5'-phosphosulfate sulfotransferase (PAPS reductase)/FAD synthetase